MLLIIRYIFKETNEILYLHSPPLDGLKPKQNQLNIRIASEILLVRKLHLFYPNVKASSSKIENSALIPASNFVAILLGASMQCFQMCV